MSLASLENIIKEKPNFIVTTIELPFNLRDNVVIDIETTGLNPLYDEIVSYGIAINSVGAVLVRAYASADEFREFCSALTKLLSELGFKLWAWYKEFEESFLGIKFNELQLWPYEKKDVSLSWGIEIPAYGVDVPSLWHQWKTNHDVVALAKIILRNMYDIIIEASSLPRKSLLKLYGVIE